ncbi:hypothetical protein HR060_18155 [Catenovulum sp. SM1970]|uniref:hypothetical protein n=1 Tax=Marinifaba aquimaris TaxID=2741323 RepID=UPI0015721207|nr:hypothetical protein [Marinifaba aquimaris]NTS78767.1 hypothetical protein [Marinifaba aquimaris]
MRNAIILFGILLLSACGGSSGGGSGSSAPSSRTPVTNKAPELVLTNNMTALSGGVISISHDVSDSEGDPITLTWTNQIDGLTITQSTMSVTSIQLPEVQQETELVLTLTATDSKNASTSKSVTIILQPKTDQTVIDIASQYTAKENTYLNFVVPITSEYTITDIEWQFDEALRLDTFTENTISDKSAQSTVQLLMPMVGQPTDYNAVITVTANGLITKEQTVIRVTPENSDYLSISLPTSYQIDEGNTGEISVNIDSSESDTQISWKWLDSDITLAGQSTKTVSFEAPEVSGTEVINLEVTVTSAIDSKTAKIPVTINDITTYSNVTLSANRSLAVKGHDVFIDVKTDNPDQIATIDWTVSELSDQNYSVDGARLNLTIPELSSGFFIDIFADATVTLTNGTERHLSQTIRVLNHYSLNSELNIGHDIDEPLALYNNEKGQFVVDVSSSHTLIDAITVDLPFSTLSFSTESAEIIDGDIIVNLLTDEITEETETTLAITAFVGDYQVNDYIKVRLVPSHYSIYPGLTELFFVGSEVKLFHQIFYDGELTDKTATWQRETLIGEIIDNPDGVSSYLSSSSFANEVELNASFNDGNADTQSSKVLDMYRALTESTDDIRCTVTGVNTYCIYDSRTTRFTLETPEQKQLKVTNDVACMLTQNSEVECLGNTNNPIISELPELVGPIERINLVGDQDACVQFGNGTWQCWGNNPRHITPLIAKFSHVYGITQYKDKTCLVADGYLNCFNEVGVADYSDKTGMIKILQERSEGLCYQYTHQKSTTWQCPNELR